MQYVIASLSYGGLYAVLGLALVLTYRSTKAMNFAQGDIAMLMAFVAITFLVGVNLPILVSLLFTAIAAVAFGSIIYNVVIYPNRRRDHLQLSIMTLGLQLAIVGVAALIWGPNARPFPSIIGSDFYRFAGLTISAGYFWTLVAAAVSVTVVSLFMKFTSLGLAMRVAAEDTDLAQLLGVNIRTIGTLAWVGACMLGAITGILMSMSVFLSPYMMGLVILKAFAAMVLGGMTSVVGVFVGGILIGLLEGAVSYLWDPIFADSVSLVLIIVVLLVRPQGIFSSAASWRA